MTAATAAEMPFGSYAQLVRNLIPSVEKICFYDDRAQRCWSSDDVEQPDLQLFVELALQRARDYEALEDDDSLSRPDEDVMEVLPVFDAGGDILGAIALVLSRTSTTTTLYRHAGMIERLLAPLLDVFAHSWRLTGTGQTIGSEPAPAVTAIKPLVRSSSSSQGVLRQVVSQVSNHLECAFSALFATSRPIALTHRVHTEEPPVDLLSVVDAFREPISRLVGTRSTTVATSAFDQVFAAGMSYKFAAYPLRAPDGQLVALLAAFREQRDNDFDPHELARLEQIALQIPTEVLRELMPEQPVPVEVVENPADEAARRAGFMSIEAMPLEAMQGGEVNVEPVDESLEERIRHALRTDGFDLYVQRISRLQSPSALVARYEVLLRLRDSYALRSPAYFWEEARLCDLLPDIDRWVVSRLLKALQAHPTLVNDGQTEFAVNVSADSVLEKTFGDFIEAQLRRSGVPARALLFEFHERDAIAHAASLERLASRLHAMGCRVALDNCRHGLDIFRTISQWPVSCLKIGQSLTQAAVSDVGAERTVRELIQVAADIGIETVGEHVEDETTRAKLASLRIDFAQGFHVAHPEPLSTLLR